MLESGGRSGVGTFHIRHLFTTEKLLPGQEHHKEFHFPSNTMKYIFKV